MPTLTIVLALVTFAVAVFVGSSLQKHAFSEDAQDLTFYRQTYLTKNGWNVKVGNYNLITLDGGKSWYACKREDGGAVTILGTAEEVFPGLVAHLEGMDALVRHATEYGPLTLTGERDFELLRNAGFTVVEE